MPKFTVIVPVYNVEKYLSRCVDSILGQTYSDFELILVDDGSTDGCAEICDVYAVKDSRVIVIHKINGGVSSARNTALDIAKGEYVAFCDSDDYWELTLLEECDNAINDSTADCVLFNYQCDFSDYTGSEHINGSQHEIGNSVFLTSEDNLKYIFTKLLKGKTGWEVWTRVFKRNVINSYRIRFCTSCNNFSEDVGFVLEFFLCCKSVISINGCLYNYLIRNQSMMRNSFNTCRLNDVNEMLKSVYERYKNVFQNRKMIKLFAIIHYVVMFNQYAYLISGKRLQELPAEIEKIEDKKAFKVNVKNLFRCYRILKKLYGKDYANRMLIFSSYCLHRNWRRYSIESGFYYKYFN